MFLKKRVREGVARTPDNRREVRAHFCHVCKSQTLSVADCERRAEREREREREREMLSHRRCL